MAHRRMFSKAIVGSARFMKMPVDSQTLYFHLGMATDDDGVVEAWSVLKTTGSAEDNLRVLATKGFIKILNEDLVSYIMDWSEHNELRADRIVPSQYRELLIQMVPEVILKEPKRRADLKPLLESGRPMDVQRTEEDRIGEDRINNTTVANAPAILEVRVSEEERAPKRDTQAEKEYEELCVWLEGKTGVRIVNRKKQYKNLANAKNADISRDRLKERALELMCEAYFKEHGIDWGNVVSSFDRKA